MYCVIDVPHFDLQAVLRTDKRIWGKPAVLAEEVGRQSRVVRVSNEARALAVEEGMTLAQALARCPDLHVRNPSPAAEKQAGATLLDVALSLAPRVEHTVRSRCTVDLTGLPPGSLEERGKQVHRQLWELGLWARTGFASTPQLALYAARWATPLRVVDNRRDFLATLPLELAEPPLKVLETLHQWGIRQMGGFLRLSRQDIATRLPEALPLWDEASESRPRPLQPTPHPVDFSESMDLEYPVETLEPLLFILQRFLDQLCIRLGNAHKVAQVVAIALQLDDASTYQREFRVPDPTRNAQRLFRMLQAHLEQLQTEAPIVGLCLKIEPGREHARQQGLFETSVRNPQRFTDTLAELTGIAGPGNLGSPRTLDTWRPDAFILAPLPDAVETVQPEPIATPHPTSLPLRRLRPPLPAQVMTTTAGEPLHLECALARGRIVKTTGPWNLSGEWWEARAAWQRSEWDVELQHGGIYRIYQTSRNWFVEGEYA